VGIEDLGQDLAVAEAGGGLVAGANELILRVAKAG